MGSALQTNLENLLLDDYTSLMIVTAMVYDYILTFLSEIEYIWNKPWTLVSTLFVIVRYLGLCGFIIGSFMESSFLPGPAKVLSVFSLWSIVVYIFAADLVMILRLWAMYNRSKIILGILLTCYLGEIVASTIACIFYSQPKSFVVIVTQILDLSFCSPSAVSGIWNKVANLSQFVHAGVMCTLVIIQFTIRSVQTYRTTKQWQLSPFINLMVMEGMAYFFAILMWSLLNTLYGFGYFSAVTPQQNVLLILVEFVPISTLTPRFILNMREMYAHSIYGRRGHGIDTGFGLTALSSHGASRSSIVFADDGEREGFGGDGEDIPMERRTA